MDTNWLHAKNILEDGTKEFPDEKDLYVTLGELYMNKELHKKAIENFQKALKITPLDENILFKNGNCFLMIDEFRLAIDQYNQCTEDLPELIYNKAFAYYKMGKIEISIELMQQILDRPLTTVMPLIFITELHFLQRDYKSAIVYIEKAEKRFGIQGNLQYLKGLAYYHQQIWLKAFVAFDQADKMGYHSVNFLLNYGIVANKIGRYKHAIKILTEYVENQPHDGHGYAELINIYLDHNDTKKADKIAKKAKKNATFTLALSLAYSKLDKRKRQE